MAAVAEVGAEDFAEEDVVDAFCEEAAVTVVVAAPFAPRRARLPARLLIFDSASTIPAAATATGP